MVEQIAEDIIYRLDQPYRLQDETAFVTASVGIAIYPDDGRTAGDLLKCADQAMYAAKNGGRNGYQYFTRSMQESVDSRMRMISDIRHALHDGQMWVAYQPVIDLHADRVSKAEVVLRWTHPQRGNIATADFIPVAEESGLINDIGEFVLSQAARQAAQWRKQSHPDFQISINVSAMQLRNSHRSVFQEWSEQLNKYQLDPSALALEINEQSLADIHPAAIDQLRLLRSAGTKIYVDDFGTGYSQLAHLRNLKVDYLKIDHSFVKGLATDNEDMALCEGIILMAHKLGMKVVAEGVETHEQRRLLTGAGCDFAQGFLYSEPVPADKFEIRSKGVPLQLLAN